MSDYLQTNGTVLSAQVGITPSLSSTGVTVQDKYFPDITYQYTVNGTTYQNNRFWNESLSINQLPKIEALVAQYPPGTPVPVYYNPTNPKDAFLQRISGGSTGNNIGLIAVAGALLVVIVILFVWLVVG